MAIINKFTGVSIAGMPQTLHVPAIGAAAHSAAAAITGRKPRTATAIVASVNRGNI
jgi:nicotinic acid phosphoribosyltransferase